MAAQIIALSHSSAGSSGWTNQELAEVFRLTDMLHRYGIDLAVEHGVSDEGDPWLVLSDPFDAEVSYHIARIDNAYVIARGDDEEITTKRHLREVAEIVLPQRDEVIIVPAQQQLELVAIVAMAVALTAGAEQQPVLRELIDAAVAQERDGVVVDSRRESEDRTSDLGRILIAAMSSGELVPPAAAAGPIVPTLAVSYTPTAAVAASTAAHEILPVPLLDGTGPAPGQILGTHQIVVASAVDGWSEQDNVIGGNGTGGSGGGDGSGPRDGLHTAAAATSFEPATVPQIDLSPRIEVGVTVDTVVIPGSLTAANNAISDSSQNTSGSQPGVAVTSPGSVTTSPGNLLALGDVHDAKFDLSAVSGSIQLSMGNGSATITGNGGSDRITVGDGHFVIMAGMGPSVIQVGNGTNVVIAAAGDATITAGDGANSIVGGSGTNTIVVGSGNNTVQGGSGSAHITVGAGASGSAVSGTNLVLAGSGDETINVAGGSASVVSGSGDDSITNNGSATITGAQDDHRDTIIGSGPTTVLSGHGSNVIVVTDPTASVTVTNFQPGIDHIIGAGNTQVTQSSGTDAALSSSTDAASISDPGSIVKLWFGGLFSVVGAAPSVSGA